MNRNVFFRADDIWDVDTKFKKLIGLFLWHKVPVHLAVIPGKLTQRCAVFLRQCLRKYPELVEIGQHGYMHVNYSKDVLYKYEFGSSRSYIQQKRDIDRGFRIMRKIAGDNMIFTPPWHIFDRNTLKVVSEFGFSGFSTDLKSRVRDNALEVRNITTSLYLNKVGRLGWFTEKAENLIHEINAVRGNSAGILIHHDKFNNVQEFNELNNLLGYLKECSGIQFIKLSAENDEVSGDIH